MFLNAKTHKIQRRWQDLKAFQPLRENFSCVRRHGLRYGKFGLEICLTEFLKTVDIFVKRDAKDS